MTGLERVSRIVRATRDFARATQSKAPENLNTALESTLVICHHETGSVADVVTELGAIPLVNCNAGELNQVFLNIIVNAAHAIGEVVAEGHQRGKIMIRTWATRRWLGQGRDQRHRRRHRARDRRQDLRPVLHHQAGRPGNRTGARDRAVDRRWQARRQARRRVLARRRHHVHHRAAGLSAQDHDGSGQPGASRGLEGPRGASRGLEGPRGASKGLGGSRRASSAPDRREQVTGPAVLDRVGPVAGAAGLLSVFIRGLPATGPTIYSPGCGQGRGPLAPKSRTVFVRPGSHAR